MIWHGKLEDFIKEYAESGENGINFLINTCRGAPVRKGIYKLYLEDGSYTSYNTYTQWLATIKHLVDLNESPHVNIDKCIRGLEQVEYRVLSRLVTVEYLNTTGTVAEREEESAVVETTPVKPPPKPKNTPLKDKRPSNKVKLDIDIPKKGVVTLDNICVKFRSKGKKLLAGQAKAWLRRVCKEHGFDFIVKDARGVKKILQELEEWVAMTRRTVSPTEVSTKEVTTVDE